MIPLSPEDKRKKVGMVAKQIKWYSEDKFAWKEVIR